MRTQHLNHSTYQHQYHIVWGTRWRRKILKDYVNVELQCSLDETIKKYPALFLCAANANSDHVHIQIEISPDIAVSDAVRTLKTASSLHLRKKFKFIRDLYLEKDGIWSAGYFSSTVGLNEGQIRRYIEWQGKQDMPQTLSIFAHTKKN